MKFALTAATVMALAMAATSAPAGVVISQETVNQTGAQKTDQTVMIQGHKRKVISGDEEELITDLDAGAIYIIKPKNKQYYEGKFPPTGAYTMKLFWDGTFVGVDKASGTDKVAGYACQNYTGSVTAARHILTMTKCVASDAPGAKEYVEFQKAMADKLKGTRLAPKGETPDGIPVSSIRTIAPVPYTPPPSLPPAAAKKLMEAMVKGNKTVTFNTTVSKIEVKDLPAETFAVPAGYTKGETQPITPHLLKKPGQSPASPGAAAAPGSAAAPAAAAPPATAPAPH